jgi:diacylglycerol kinase (ATP)
LLGQEKAAVLFNPAAGKGRALRKKPRLESLLRQHAIPYDLIITRSEDHLRQLVRESAFRYHTLAGAGGDSTFQIMVEELVRTGARVNLGMFGLGSSNDIPREFGLDSLEKACAALKMGRTRDVDIGEISDGRTLAKPFVGQASLGLGFWVNRYVEDLSVRRRTLARFQNLAGILGVVRSYRAKKIPLALTVETASGCVEGEFVLAVFSNIRYWAAGRLLNPGARPDDGRLDACLIGACSFLRLARLARLAQAGNHVDAAEISILQQGEFTVSSEHPFSVQVDGEILGGRLRPLAFLSLRFQAIPRALRILA